MWVDVDMQDARCKMQDARTEPKCFDCMLQGSNLEAAQPRLMFSSRPASSLC